MRRPLEDLLDDAVARFLKSGNWESSVRAVLEVPKPESCPQVREWRKIPYVARRIAEVRKKVSTDIEFTLKDHLDTLAQLRDEAREEGNFGAAIKAEVSRGQAMGFYDRKNGGRIIEGESTKKLSTDDLRQRLAQLERMETKAQAKRVGWDGEEDVEDATLL